MNYTKQQQTYKKCVKTIQILHKLQNHSLYLSTQNQYMNDVLKHTRSIPNDKIHDTRSYIQLCKQLKNMNLISEQKIHIHKLGYNISLYQIDIKPHGSFVLDQCRTIMNRIQKSWTKANQHPKRQKYNILISISCLIGLLFTVILHIPTWVSITLLVIPCINLIDSVSTSFRELYNNKKATKLESELQSVLGIE